MVAVPGIKIHRVIALLVGVLCFALPKDSLAGDRDAKDELADEFALLEEEDVVFIASKHEQPVEESPSAVTVITREQIENSHCTELICLLRLAPEVDVRMVAPLFVSVGAQALTGLIGDKAMVLVDGREINIELFGIPLWQSLPVHPEDIGRVEIIRGPASALYGANAHSMVVSITTRRTVENAVEIFLGAGERDHSSLHLRLDRLLGDWRLHLSGGYEANGHWQLRGRRDRELFRLRLRVDHQGGSATSSIQLGLTTPEGEIFTGLSPGVVDAWLGHLLLAHGTDTIKAQVSLSVFDVDLHMDLPLYYGASKLGDMPDNLPFFTSNLDSEVQINLSPFKGNLLIAGGNYRWLALLSEVNQPDEVHQHRTGLFLHDEQRVGDRLVLTGGVRFDYNNISPPAVSPRLAGVWRFARSQFLRLAFGRAFKKPAFFYTSTHLTGIEPAAGFEGIEDFFLRSIGNDDLGNEIVTSFEAGYIGHFLDKRLRIEADAFFNLYRDTVAFVSDMVISDLGVPDLGRSLMQFDNQGMEVNTVGGTVAVGYHIKNSLRLHASYAFRHSWYVSKPTEDFAPAGSGKGDRVLWEPAHLAKFSLHYFTERGLRLGTSLYGQSSAKMVMREKGGLFDRMITVLSPPFCFVGAFIAWRVRPAAGGPGWAEFGLRAYNIFATPFRDQPAVTRTDGVEVGGQLLDRRIFLFFRGAI